MLVWVLPCAPTPTAPRHSPRALWEGCSPPLTKLEALCIQEPAA